MIGALMIVAFCLPAAGAPADGLPAAPDGPNGRRDTSIVEQVNGPRLVGFVMKDESDKPLDVLLDEPGALAPRHQFIPRENLQACYAESAEDREKRWSEYFEREGWARVKGADGWRWVKKTELDLANTAREMASAAAPAKDSVEGGGAPPQDVESAEAASPAGEAQGNSATAPGFFSMWGRHLLIVIAGGALIACAAWAAFRRT